MSDDNLSNKQLSNKYPTDYFFTGLFLSMAYELAASLEKLTEARLRTLSSDIFSKRSATAPRKVGIAFTYTAIITPFSAKIHKISTRLTLFLHFSSVFNVCLFFKYHSRYCKVQQKASKRTQNHFYFKYLTVDYFCFQKFQNG